METLTINVDRTPETELLAGLLQKDLFDRVRGKVTADDFMDTRNREIFVMIERIENEGKLSDIVYVIRRLASNYHLDKAGGREYILAVAKMKRRMSVDSAVNALLSLKRKNA